MELKKYRELRNLTLQKFAQGVGVNWTQVWRWENGRSMPRPSMVQRIREFTGGAVTVDDHHRAFESYYSSKSQREAS